MSFQIPAQRAQSDCRSPCRRLTNIRDRSPLIEPDGEFAASLLCTRHTSATSRVVLDQICEREGGRCAESLHIGGTRPQAPSGP
eukprot:s3312_g12.t1